MPSRLLISCAAVFVSACAAVTPEPVQQEVDFVCSNGEKLAVRFMTAGERAVLLRHGQAIELQQRPSGSGFIYSNGPNTIRGKGDQLTVEIGRMLPIECRAQR